MDRERIGRSSGWAVASLALLFGLHAPASASFVASLDAFQVLKNSTTFFFDPFDNGFEPPEGNGINPAYGVAGGFSATAESTVTGRLAIDTALGAPSMNAAGDPRLTVSLNLLTDTTGTNEAVGLYKQHDLIVGALFDIVPMEGPFSIYAVGVRDFGTTGTRELLQLQVSRNDASAPGAVSIIFLKQVFGVGSTLLGSTAFAPPAGADRIGMRLVHVADSDSFTASYRFWDASGPLSDFVALGGVGTMFNDRVYVVPTLFAAIQPAVPIPEPGTYALLLAGLAAVAWMARRRAMTASSARPTAISA